jgi:DNA topoisomerase I
MAGIGRFGPYLQHDGKYKSIPKDDDVLTIGLNRAVDLLAQESKGRGGRGAPPGKPIGEHPEDKQPVTVHEGRYGPYVKWGKINATIPKSIEPSSLTLDQAIGLIAERAEKMGGGKPKKAKAAPKAKKAAAKPELGEPAPKAVKPKTAKKAAAKTPANDTAPVAEKAKAAKKAVKKAAKKSAE